MKEPKVIAYIPLLYGSEYLSEAIKSIEPFVKKIMVFYTSRPSFGFGTEIKCPDDELTLRIIAEKVSSKVNFVSGYWGNEGAHRGAIYDYAKGYDCVITLDADEVFEPQDIPSCIEHVMNSKERYFGVNGYVNFWKNFNWEVKDFFRPIRYINLHNEGGQGEVMQRIYHFSCAQREEIMRYKYLVHGHHDELKPNWLEDYYFAWNENNQLKNLHPTANGIWGEALPFDKETLPELLKNHPNFNKEVL